MTSGTFALCIFILNRPVDPAAGAAQRLCGIRARLRAAGDSEAAVDAAGGSASATGAGTGWVWDGGKTHGSKEVKVPATFAIPLNPAMNMNLDKVVFALDSLTAVFATLEMLIESTPDATSKLVKSSSTSVDGLPYHPSLEAGTRVSRPRSSLKCRICSRDGINISDMRHHIGAHVLHAQMLPKKAEEGNLEEAEEAKAAEMKELLSPVTCGFCGRSDGMCESFLKQGSKKGVEICTSTCPDAPREGALQTWDVALQMGHARKGSTYKPCLNLPMACELCPGKKYVWKYNMAAHIKTVHSEVDGGGTLKFRSEIAISEAERTKVLDLIGVTPTSSSGRSNKRTTTRDTRTQREVRQRQSGVGASSGGSSLAAGTMGETRV